MGFVCNVYVVPVLCKVTNPVMRLFTVSTLFFRFLAGKGGGCVDVVCLLVTTLSTVTNACLKCDEGLALTFLPRTCYGPLRAMSKVCCT